MLTAIVTVLPAIDVVFGVEDIPESPRAARRVHIPRDKAKHGAGGRDHGGYCEYCGEGRMHGRTVAAAAAAAAVAQADADYALAMADAAEDAARLMRSVDPLAYSSDHGYIV